MAMMMPDWPGLFRAVCARGATKALGWGLPEQWVHAELFAELRDRSSATGWTPFETEIPYATFCPVDAHVRRDRDWREDAAVKWVDICLRSSSGTDWLWFELKVRHAGKGDREASSAKEAREAFKKDVGALIGFDAPKTAATWREPDQFTKAYWIEETLGPHAKALPESAHHFVSAFLLLGGSVEAFPDLWSTDALMQAITRWFSGRAGKAEKPPPFPADLDIRRVTGLAGEHSLVLCEW